MAISIKTVHFPPEGTRHQNAFVGNSSPSVCVALSTSMFPLFSVF